jgi:hypothetical protein
LRKGLVLLLAGAALGAVPAAAQTGTAPVRQVFETYNDCFAATNTASLAPAELEKLGWQRASVESSKGDKITDAPIIFAHADRSPLILLSGLEGQGICVVTARIESYAVFDEFKAAFGDKLPRPDKKGNITYQAEGRIVQIAPTGSPEKPSLKLVVGTRMESK